VLWLFEAVPFDSLGGSANSATSEFSEWSAMIVVLLPRGGWVRTVISCLSISVLQLSLCHRRFPIAVLQTLVYNCRVWQLSLCKCRFAVVVLQLLFRNVFVVL